MTTNEFNMFHYKTLENKTLQWYGHVNRMNEARWPKG